MDNKSINSNSNSNSNKDNFQIRFDEENFDDRASEILSIVHLQYFIIEKVTSVFYNIYHNNIYILLCLIQQ